MSLPTLPIGTTCLTSTVLAWAWAALGAPPPLDAQVSLSAQPTLRRPISLVLGKSRKRLDVANRRGTLSTMDTDTGDVWSEVQIGKRLDWLAPLGDGPAKHLIAVDSESHQLIVMKRLPLERQVNDDTRQPAVSVATRIPVSRHSVYCIADRKGERVYISSLWSRRVTCLQRTGRADRTESWRVAWRRDLSLAPRLLTLIPDTSELLVADAFGNRIAVLASSSGTVKHIRKIPGHQFRGMALMPDRRTLLLAQQILNPLARTDDNDVHWGILMSNDLRWLRLAALANARIDPFDDSHMTPLGEAGHAAADPAGVAVFDDQTVVVTIGGVGEIAYGKPSDYIFRRMRVGRRPTAVVADSHNRVAYIANTFDDTISVIDLRKEEVTAVWELGPQRPLSLAERGELAFFDGRLSMDGWMSCQSCHVDGHTNGQLNDNMSDGSFETSKRVLSLLGKRDTAPFAWAGNAATLEIQIGRSIQRTMRLGESPSDESVKAIAAYLRSLPPPPGVDQARGIVDTDMVARGRGVFTAQGCAECHSSPRYTIAERRDVGLQDEQGLREFNPPSLLGVSQRDRWLHDGRAATLADVFRKYRHQLETELPQQQLADLLAFLRQL